MKVTKVYKIYYDWRHYEDENYLSITAKLLRIIFDDTIDGELDYSYSD